MYPPIFAACSAYAPLTAIIGTDPVRLYPALDAPQDETKPYVVWQIIGGAPENYLGDRPDMDRYALQIDAYATTLTAVRNLGQKLRDVIEPLAYITSFRGESKEADTNLYRVSFDIDWMEDTANGQAGTYATGDWTAATLLNSWVNMGGGYQPAEYRRVPDRGNYRVDVRLVVSAASGNRVIFNLPADHRPTYEVGFSAQVHDNSNNPDYGHIRVRQNGDVELEHPGSINNHKVLATFSFFAA